MKYFASLMLVAASIAGQTAYATSTLSFAGGKFDIQVVVSDTSDQITDVRLYEGDGLVIAAAGKELEAVRYDPNKQTLSFIVPAKGDAPRVVLVVRGRNATLTYGTKRVRLRGDWVR